MVIAWSLGVLDTLASIHTQGDRLLAGLVLVDNSVGKIHRRPIIHCRGASGRHHPVPRR